MPYIPSYRVQELLRWERSGVWIDNSDGDFPYHIIAKLPMYLLRAVDAGVPVQFDSWVIRTEDGAFAAFGLTIHDGEDHPSAVYGACRSTEEVLALHDVLANGSVPIQFHNENRVSLLSATGNFDVTRTEPIRATLPLGKYPLGDGVEMRKKALDVVERSLLENAPEEPQLIEKMTVDFKLVSPQRQQSFLFGSDGSVGRFHLDETNHGKELEVATLHLFDPMFPFGSFHSPLRDTVDGRKELCDVLALNRVPTTEQEGIFVVQNKVLPTTEATLKRTAERRGKSIQKNILEAIGQTGGAIKKLKEGVQVYKSDGTKIEEDAPAIVGQIPPLNLAERAQQVGCGIIVISDMDSYVEWNVIWDRLAEEMRKWEYQFHVLDLRELHNLLLHANEDPMIFALLLLRRVKIMVSEGTANVRLNFKDA